MNGLGGRGAAVELEHEHVRAGKLFAALAGAGVLGDDEEPAAVVNVRVVGPRVAALELREAERAA